MAIHDMLKRLFPGEWVTSSADGAFCVMGPETAVHTTGRASSSSQRLEQAVSMLMVKQ